MPKFFSYMVNPMDNTTIYFLLAKMPNAKVVMNDNCSL